MRRSHGSLLVLVLLVAVAGCVSRNVQPLDDEEAAAMSPPPAPVERRAAGVPEAETAELTGLLEVAPELQDRVPGGDAILYLFVRVAGREGGPPLRVQRLSPSFPMEFSITEGDAMIPGTPLVDEMTVVARVDQDGDAFTEDPGDLVGEVGPIGPQPGELRIVLDRVVEGGGAP